MFQVIAFVIVLTLLYGAYLLFTNPKTYFPKIFLSFSKLLKGEYTFIDLWLHGSVWNLVGGALWVVFKARLIFALFAIVYIFYQLCVFIGWVKRTRNPQEPFIEFIQRLSFLTIITLPSCGVAGLAILFILKVYNL